MLATTKFSTIDIDLDRARNPFFDVSLRVS